MANRAKKAKPGKLCKTWRELERILAKDGGEDKQEAARIADFWEKADYLFGEEDERTGNEPMMALAWCALGIAYPSTVRKWQEEYGSLSEGYDVAKTWLPNKVPGVEGLKDVKAWLSVPGVKEPKDAKAWLTVPGVDNALSSMATDRAKGWIENLEKTHSKDEKRDWVKEAKKWLSTGGSIDDWKALGVVSLDQIDRISVIWEKDKNKSKFKTLKAYVERMNDQYGYITGSENLESWANLAGEDGNPWKTRQMWVQKAGISDPKVIHGWLTVPGVKSADDVSKWVNIGIVMNPEKAKAWLTVPGIEGPDDAKGWTDLSGFTPDDAKRWIKDKFTDSDNVSEWIKHGCEDPKAAIAWRDIGVVNPSDLDKWKQSSKSGENPFEVAKAWIGIGIKDPEAVWDWRNFKFGIEDARPWGQAGVTNRKDAQAWINRNMGSQDAQPWAEIGVTNPENVDEWKDVDGVENPSDAKEWMDAGFKKAENARPWAKEEFSPPEAKKWNDKGFDAPDALLFRKNGFTLKEAQRWFDAGFKESGLEKAIAWHNQGIDPETARAWYDKKFDPAEAERWINAGVKKPADAEYLQEKYKIGGDYIKVLYCKKLNSLITDEIVKEAAETDKRKFKTISQTSLSAPMKWIAAELIPLGKKIPLKFIRKCIDADIYQPDRIKEEYKKAKKEEKKEEGEKSKENGKIHKRKGFRDRKENVGNSKEIAEFWCDKVSEVWKDENIGKEGADNPITWIDAGWNNPEKAAVWREAGWEDPVDARIWRKTGFPNARVAMKWHRAWAKKGPKQALKYHVSGFNVPGNAADVARKVYKPTDKNIALIAALCQGLPGEDVNETLEGRKLPGEKINELHKACKKINSVDKVKKLWTEYKSEYRKYECVDPGEVVKLKTIVKDPSKRYENLEKCVESIVKFLKEAKKGE